MVEYNAITYYDPLCITKHINVEELDKSKMEMFFIRTGFVHNDIQCASGDLRSCVAVVSLDSVIKAFDISTKDSFNDFVSCYHALKSTKVNDLPNLRGVVNPNSDICDEKMYGNNICSFLVQKLNIHVLRQDEQLKYNQNNCIAELQNFEDNLLNKAKESYKFPKLTKIIPDIKKCPKAFTEVEEFNNISINVYYVHSNLLAGCHSKYNEFGTEHEILSI